MPGSPKRKRVVACDLCKARKVKCNGECPCNVCTVRGEQCRTTARSRKREARTTEDAVHERLRRLEALVQESSSAEVARDEDGDRTHMRLSRSVPASATTSGDPWPSQKEFVPLDRERMTSMVPKQGNAAPTGGEVGSTQHSPDVLSTDEQANVKYHGPHAALSVCSKPAIEYIQQKLQSDKFQPAAARLVHIVARRMFRLPGPISRERKPDPPADEAWQYVDAYFAEGPETAFGVVRRDLFQPRLEAHFAGYKKDENPAIYAIRNCILASGCRIKMAPILGYAKAVEMASGWFENALSVHTELLYMSTTIISVTALVIMASYAEGIGGPLLPYMLSSCAIRLACSKGLHREPAASWGINEAESRHRHGIFWAAYCIDQSAAASSGRPPTISIDMISCKPPEAGWSGGMSDGLYSMAMVKLHELHAQVGRLLLSDNSVQHTNVFFEAVRALTDQVQIFQTKLRPSIDVGEAFDSSRLPTGRQRDMALRLLYKYYELLFRIHSSVVYPWFRPAWKTPQPEEISRAMQESAAVLSWVSRQVLLSISEVRLDPSCRLWMAIVVPLHACIDAFVRMIEDPSRASFHSDLALLELGVAHFARLELYSDGKYSIPFARELAQLASELHNRVLNDAASQGPDESTTLGLITPATKVADFPDSNEMMSMDSWPESINDVLDLEWWNNDFGSWDLDGWV